jgi:hypothetical protein
VTEIASIKGGADAATAAAIAAAVAHVDESEAETRATRPPVPKPSPWVQSSRPRDIPPPLISHQFDAATWTESGKTGE